MAGEDTGPASTTGSTSVERTLTPEPLSMPKATADEGAGKGGAAAAEAHRRDEGTEGEEELVCRFCRDEDSRDRLIRPCHCAGSSAFVHPACLDSWRSVSVNAFVECTVCKYKYGIAPGPNISRTWSSFLKFCALCARDLALVAMATLLVFYVVGRIIYEIDASFESCEPECQDPAILLEMEQAPDRPFGPLCVPCAPLRSAMFDLNKSMHYIVLSFGSTFLLSSLGFVVILTNALGFTGWGGRVMFDGHTWYHGAIGNGNNQGSLLVVILGILSFVGAVAATYYVGAALYKRALDHARSLRLITLANDYVVVDRDAPARERLLSPEEVMKIASRATWQRV